MIKAIVVARAPQASMWVAGIGCNMVVGALLAAAAAKALGESAGKELAGRVADLVGLVDAQQQLLGAIRGDVRALIEGPQKAALSHLADARVAQSPQVQRKLLEEARTELAQAAAQETDPLRRSYAWLLSATVWLALDENEGAIITRHLQHAYKSALEAAQAMADPATEPPRALRYFLGPSRLLAAPVLLPRMEVKHRPASFRVEFVASLGVPGVSVEEYIATKTAKERELKLTEVHRYVCGLRELLLARSPKAGLPAHRARLVPGIQVRYRWPRTTATLWALVYEQVPSDEPVEPCDAPSLLSEGRRPVAFKVRRRNDRN